MCTTRELASGPPHLVRILCECFLCFSLVTSLTVKLLIVCSKESRYHRAGYVNDGEGKMVLVDGMVDGNCVTLTLGVERVHSSPGPVQQKAPGTAEKVIECLL